MGRRFRVETLSALWKLNCAISLEPLHWQPVSWLAMKSFKIVNRPINHRTNIKLTNSIFKEQRVFPLEICVPFRGQKTSVPVESSATRHLSHLFNARSVLLSGAPTVNDIFSLLQLFVAPLVAGAPMSGPRKYQGQRSVQELFCFFWRLFKNK